MLYECSTKIERTAGLKFIYFSVLFTRGEEGGGPYSNPQPKTKLFSKRNSTHEGTCNNFSNRWEGISNSPPATKPELNSSFTPKNKNNNKYSPVAAQTSLSVFLTPMAAFYAMTIHQWIADAHYLKNHSISHWVSLHKTGFMEINPNSCVLLWPGQNLSSMKNF